MEQSAIRTPKQCGHSQGRETWYPYYAGFSTDFARSALRRYSPVDGKPVCDPWNGGGTTTQVSSELGFKSVGFDINPAMIVVAKARRLQATVKESISPLATQLLLKINLTTSKTVCPATDPLSRWLTPKSLIEIRKLENTVREHFIPHGLSSPVIDLVSSPTFSDLAAFFYLMLFRAVRHLLKPFRTANPTWLSTPTPRRRLRPRQVDIHNAFRSAIDHVLGVFPDETPRTQTVEASSELLLADSRSLSLASGSVGGILTSPPYLTRLDYAVSTAPELALLGQDEAQFRKLREDMLGTTLVTGAWEANTKLGIYTQQCLNKIRDHKTKASRSYYYKNTSRYLHGLNCSFVELSRVLAPRAPMIVVVQDSFYKDVHLDLPRIVQEIGEQNGLKAVDMHKFVVEKHMGLVHTRHRAHCKRSARYETVVVMQQATTGEHNVN